MEKMMYDLLNGTVGSIKGHFWIKLEDGRIIDPYFEVYDAIKYMKNLEGDPVYRECNSQIQKEMIREHILPSMVQALKMDEIKEIKGCGDMSMDIKFVEGYCHINTIINKIRYGNSARICYGDFGWAIQGKPNKIFYEYEHGWDGKCDDRVEMNEMMNRLMKRPDMLKLILNTHIRKADE